MSDLLKFAYHIAGQAECYKCGVNFNYNTLRFDPSVRSYDFEAETECPSCSIAYVFLIEDVGHGVSLEIFEKGQDINSDLPVSNHVRHKASLHKDLHQAKDLVEGIFELMDALEILEVNKERIDTSVAELRQPQGFDTTDEFDQELDADLHNYLASAYSFKKILDTVRGDLPMGGKVEHNLEEFEEEHKVISGLRTYVQHYLTLPTSYSQHADPRTGGRRISVVVDVADVAEIDSDKDRYPPDGYLRGFEHHYGGVKGEFIDLDRCVQSHYDAAVTLVSEILSHTKDVRGDDLVDYARRTDHMEYYDK